MAISGTSETSILALIFNATAWVGYALNHTTTPETSIAVALHTADPGTAGTMSTTEITYSSYARLSGPVRTSGGWAVSGTGPATCNPVAAITFAAGTGGAGTATHFSTGKSGGGAAVILFSGTVTPNVICGNGVTPQLTTATAITLS